MAPMLVVLTVDRTDCMKAAKLVAERDLKGVVK